MTANARTLKSQLTSMLFTTAAAVATAWTVTTVGVATVAIAAVLVSAPAHADRTMNSKMDMDMPGAQNEAGMDDGMNRPSQPMDGMPKGTPVTPVDPSCPMPFPSQNLCAVLIFTSAPIVGKSSKFELEFHNQLTGTLQDPIGEVGVYLWMQMMGHGSAPVAIAHTNGSGVYLVTKAYFVMQGTWDVHVTLKDSNVTEEAASPVTL